MARRFEMTDDQWIRIEPLLPGRSESPGATAKNNRLFVDAVLWIARTGAPWRDLPERFGSWNTTFQRFNRWAKSGVWTRVMEALGKSKDKAVKDDAQFSELTEAIEALASHAQEQGAAFTAEQKARQELSDKVTKLETELNDLVKRLSETEDHSQQQRPSATGGDGKVLTKF